MVTVKEDLVGQTFGRLTVIKQVEDYISPGGYRAAQWLCECSCPDRNKVVVVGSKLKNNHTCSCGCFQKEQTSLSNKKDNLYSEMLVDENGKFFIGWTSNTNEEFYFDATDYDLISKYHWYEHINSKNGYHALEAIDPDTNKHIRMHYLIIGKHCDHEDRNPLNNRRYNLRLATALENSQNRSVAKNNTSGVIGVYWEKKRNKWNAKITVDKKQINLGRFENKEDAIKARLLAENIYFKEFAPQRHLFDQYSVVLTKQN